MRQRVSRQWSRGGLTRSSEGVGLSLAKARKSEGVNAFEVILANFPKGEDELVQTCLPEMVA